MHCRLQLLRSQNHKQLVKMIAKSTGVNHKLVNEQLVNVTVTSWENEIPVLLIPIVIAHAQDEEMHINICCIICACIYAININKLTGMPSGTVERSVSNGYRMFSHICS